MSRNYISIKSKINKNVYMQVRYKLADYDRLKLERLNILYGSGKSFDGLPNGNAISNPTEVKALKLAYLENELDGINQAVEFFEKLYNKKTYEEFDVIKAYWSYNYFNYMHKRGSEEDNGPCERTWRRFKWAFAEKVAENLKLF